MSHATDQGTNAAPSNAIDSDIAQLVNGLQRRLSQKHQDLNRLSGILRDLRPDVTAPLPTQPSTSTSTLTSLTSPPLSVSTPTISTSVYADTVSSVSGSNSAKVYETNATAARETNFNTSVTKGIFAEEDSMSHQNTNETTTLAAAASMNHAISHPTHGQVAPSNISYEGSDPVANQIIRDLQRLVESLLGHIAYWRTKATQTLQLLAAERSRSASNRYPEDCHPVSYSASETDLNSPSNSWKDLDHESLKSLFQQEQIASAFAREQVRILKIEVDTLQRHLDQERQGRLKAIAAIDALEGEPDDLHIEERIPQPGPLSTAARMKIWASSDLSQPRSPSKINTGEFYSEVQDVRPDAISQLHHTDRTARALFQETSEYTTSIDPKRTENAGNYSASFTDPSLRNGEPAQIIGHATNHDSYSASNYIREISLAFAPGRRTTTQNSLKLEDLHDPTSTLVMNEHGLNDHSPDYIGTEDNESSFFQHAPASTLPSEYRVTSEKDAHMSPPKIKPDVPSSTSDTTKPAVVDPSLSLSAGSKKTQDLYTRWKAAQKQPRSNSSQHPQQMQQTQQTVAETKVESSVKSKSSSTKQSSSAAPNTHLQNHSVMNATANQSNATLQPSSRHGVYATVVRPSSQPSQRILAAYAAHASRKDASSES
eukprot:TRINITY_DN3781_c0_g2_i1.p1 TRINITY_DN3781_c0_g2~~TRINITY_DN3781_c0_g2_i1.p1  ORF type:complete len:656 (+),score=126.51 TRINITY_DN3781_c0_g2_i1:50-2017(+)